MPGRAPQAGPARRAGAHHRARPRGRPVRRRERGPPRTQPGHGEDPRLGHPDQAGPQQPGPGGPARPRRL